MQEFKQNTAVLIITTACVMLIYNILSREESMTKLDLTYLFMLVFLCINSLLKKE